MKKYKIKIFKTKINKSKKKRKKDLCIHQNKRQWVLYLRGRLGASGPVVTHTHTKHRQPLSIYSVFSNPFKTSERGSNDKMEDK